MSDKAAGQKVRSPEGCDENGPAAALLLSHVSIHSTRCRLLMASLSGANRQRDMAQTSNGSASNALSKRQRVERAKYAPS
jgi:hypothetical protein